MRRALPLLLLCITASTAAADGFYYSEALGGGQVKDELSAYIRGTFRARVALGMRRGSWALEAYVSGDAPFDGGDPQGGCCVPPGGSTGRVASLFTYGLDLKYLQPIAKHFDLYLRGGLSHAYLRGALDDRYDGRGLGVGAGIALKGRVPLLGLLFWPLFFTDLGPKCTAALFVDDGYDFYRLHEGGRLDAAAIDGQLTHVTVGFAVGSDF
jgi:hypothetical protein